MQGQVYPARIPRPVTHSPFLPGPNQPLPSPADLVSRITQEAAENKSHHIHPVLSLFAPALKVTLVRGDGPDLAGTSKPAPLSLPQCIPLAPTWRWGRGAGL